MTTFPPLTDEQFEAHEYRDWLDYQQDLADEREIERMEDERAYGREERDDDLDWTF